LGAGFGVDLAEDIAHAAGDVEDFAQFGFGHGLQFAALDDAGGRQAANRAADRSTARVQLVRDLLGRLLGRIADQQPGPHAAGHPLHAPGVQVLAELFDELDDLYAANPDAQRLPDEQITLSVLSWWINEQLIGRLAEERDLTATATAIDQVLGADQEQRDAIALSNSIPPSRLDAAAEVFVLSNSLAESLAAEGASPEEAQAELGVLLRETAADLGVSVSPRFGSWNSEAVAVEPRDPDRLSTPASGVAEPPELDVPTEE